MLDFRLIKLWLIRSKFQHALGWKLSKSSVRSLRTDFGDCPSRGDDPFTLGGASRDSEELLGARIWISAASLKRADFSTAFGDLDFDAVPPPVEFILRMAFSSASMSRSNMRRCDADISGRSALLLALTLIWPERTFGGNIGGSGLKPA